MKFYSILLLFWILGIVILPKTESCLPSWFRKTRSSEPEALQAKPEETEETNEIGEEDPGLTTLTPNFEDSAFTNEKNEKNSTTNEELERNELENAVKGVVDTEAEYAYEYEEATNKEDDSTLKYNEDATKAVTSTMKPEVRREIEKLKDAKCKDYCHHNATCHVEVIFRDDRVSAVVPSCHCPHGWEGLRCDRHYVQAFYAPVSRYNDDENTVNTKTRVANITGAVRKYDEDATPILADIRQFIWQSSTSAIPAFAFLVVMLLMFIAIVVYAYRRMSRRIDDTTYTMSHMCPPEAFTVLKTPNSRKISMHHHESMFVATSSSIQSSAGGAQRVPGRAMAIKTKSNDANKNNFLAILRNQGTIPSRSINEDDTPKHYKSVPRVEVSAINYSGHIDFSTVSYSSEEPSQAAPHVAIDMEKGEAQTSRCHSRADGEPSTPTTSQPMIFNNQ